MHISRVVWAAIWHTCRWKISRAILQIRQSSSCYHRTRVMQQMCVRETPENCNIDAPLVGVDTSRNTTSCLVSAGRSRIRLRTHSRTLLCGFKAFNVCLGRNTSWGTRTQIESRPVMCCLDLYDNRCAHLPLTQCTYKFNVGHQAVRLDRLDGR